MIVNKRLVEDSEDVLARKVFVTLVKLYPRGYSILNDGNFVKKIYAASDDEAIRQFNELATKGQLLTESVKKTVEKPITESKHQTLVESVMSDLDLEVKEAGGKEAWIANIDEQIDDLAHYLNYLKKNAYNEVNRGGNFESADEVDEAVRNCEKQLSLLKSKKQIVKERKDECVDEALHGMNEIEQFVKMAKAIGLKTMADFKYFMDREGQGKDVLTALYDYLHDEIGDLNFQAKDESLKEDLAVNGVDTAEHAIKPAVIIIRVESSSGADGFTVIVEDTNGNIIDQHQFRYGYNVSYSELGVDKYRPFVTDIINRYLSRYNLNKDNIIVTKGRNVFKGTDVSDEDITDFKNDYLGSLLDESKSELLKEDVSADNEKVQIDATSEPITVEVTTEKSPIEEMQEKISIEQVLSDLIKDEFEAIDGYSSSLATLKILENDGSDYSGIIANLEDIKNEELVHVGQLQKCLAEVNPKAEAIDDGKEEASETIAVAEEETAKGEEPSIEA